MLKKMSVRTRSVASVLTPRSIDTVRTPSDMDCVLGSRHTGEESSINLKVGIFLSRNLVSCCCENRNCCCILKIDADAIFMR